MFAAQVGLIFSSLTKVKVQEIRMRNKTGFLYAVVFHLSGSVYFFLNVVRGLDVHMEQKHYTQDKINIVLSSVDYPYDYLQDQILWFCPYKMCCKHTV